MATRSQSHLKFGHDGSHERVIMALLTQGRPFTIEEILDQVPTLSWSEIFFAIDLLSRRGDVALYRQGFTYTVELAPHHFIGNTHG